jgi:hypothetical protein
MTNMVRLGGLSSLPLVGKKSQLIIRFRLHFYFYFCCYSRVWCTFFCQFPLIQRLPFTIRVYLVLVVRLSFICIMSLIFRSLFHLLMDELTHAVVPFLPSSGGMYGGSITPPGPSGGGGSSFFPLFDPNDHQELPGTSSDLSHNHQSTPQDEPGGPAAAHQPVSRNLSVESSILNRIRCLENEDSPFLNQNEKGEYAGAVKKALNQAPSQGEYARLLEFENRDLLIREGKHSCYSVFAQILDQHPALAENACYNALESFIDFFDEKRNELDTHPEWSPAERDRRELLLLDRVRADMRERGPDSIYVRQILESG